MFVPFPFVHIVSLWSSHSPWHNPLHFHSLSPFSLHRLLSLSRHCSSPSHTHCSSLIYSPIFCLFPVISYSLYLTLPVYLILHLQLWLRSLSASLSLSLHSEVTLVLCTWLTWAVLCLSANPLTLAICDVNVSQSWWPLSHTARDNYSICSQWSDGGMRSGQNYWITRKGG